MSLESRLKSAVNALEKPFKGIIPENLMPEHSKWEPDESSEDDPTPSPEPEPKTITVQSEEAYDSQGATSLEVSFSVSDGGYHMFSLSMYEDAELSKKLGTQTGEGNVASAMFDSPLTTGDTVYYTLDITDDTVQQYVGSTVLVP